MNVVGLDLSLTATGVAGPDGTSVLTPPDRQRKRGEQRTIEDNLRRLEWLDTTIQDLLDDYHADVVVLEGYSFGSTSGREEAGELGGLVRVACWRRRLVVPYAIGKKRTTIGVPPSTLKQFACNEAQADKPKMALRARDNGWVGDDHNAADAWWLRQMGLLWATTVGLASADDCNVLPTSYRAAALGKLTWLTDAQLAVAS